MKVYLVIIIDSCNKYISLSLCSYVQLFCLLDVILTHNNSCHRFIFQCIPLVVVSFGNFLHFKIHVYNITKFHKSQVKILITRISCTFCLQVHTHMTTLMTGQGVIDLESLKTTRCCFLKQRLMFIVVVVVVIVPVITTLPSWSISIFQLFSFLLQSCVPLVVFRSLTISW